MKTETKKEYYKNEIVSRENSYLINTFIRQGIQKQYFENGKIFEICHFRQGTCYNIRQIWNNNESRRFIQTWKDHNQHGFQIYLNYEK
jgi:antitoxin component YwqK of YwqJK toxin-antitoxin module